MREDIIKAEPFEFLGILDVEIEKRVNEHITAKIVGVISPEKEDGYIESPSSGRTVRITARRHGGEEKILFTGLVYDISIQYQSGLRILVIQAVSCSYLMDIARVTRTYQNKNMTYGDVTRIMGNDDPKFAFLQPQFGDERIGRLFVQYDETNWQFAKRIASRLNTCAVADYIQDFPYVSIGMPGKRSDDGTIHPIEYTMKKDLSEFLGLSANNVPGVHERDVIYYEVKCREIFELCEKVSFKGRDLYVYAISSKLTGGRLVHTYTLKGKSGFVFKETFNDKIIGASLSGKVIEIKSDVVRVSVDGDVAQSEYKWFSYSTVYSSPDGTGWYFMPEISDSIRVHFPTEHESDAFVISSAHQQSEMRSDPDVKSIATKHGKCVVFRPDSILISNGAGSNIELSDDNGISINTDKEINICADSGINVQSKSKVVMQGDAGVAVTQNDSVINISDAIDIVSGHVRIR